MRATRLFTVQQHILEEQRRHHPHATGEFSWLLSGITLAAKVIAEQVRRAGLAGVLGATGEPNVQGEAVRTGAVAAVMQPGAQAAVPAAVAKPDPGDAVARRRPALGGPAGGRQGGKGEQDKGGGQNLLHGGDLLRRSAFRSSVSR